MHLLQTEQWCVRGGLGVIHFLQMLTTSTNTVSYYNRIMLNNSNIKEYNFNTVGTFPAGVSTAIT